MKYAAWISILAMTFAVAACGDDESTGEAQDVSDILALTGDATAGGAIYTGAGTCASASCHGSTGDDGAGAKLTEVVPGLSDEAMALSIRYGKGTMTAQPNLTAQQIADSIAYIKTLGM